MGGSGKRSSSDRAVAEDSTSTALVLRGVHDRSRSERSEFTRLMRCGTSAEIHGAKCSLGFPTVVRKQRKLLQASPCPSAAALGAKRTLSDLTGRCQGLLCKKGRVEARQRAAEDQAGPGPASETAVALAVADNGQQLATADPTAGVGRLAAAARHDAAVGVPAQAADPDVPAYTGGPLVRAADSCDRGLGGAG